MNDTPDPSQYVYLLTASEILPHEMHQGSKLFNQIQSWERDIHGAIDTVQTISQKEKNLLQLHLETHPLPFQPSPVLVSLLKNDRRRRNISSEFDSSSTQSKLQRKSTDYLERKVESEMRQHFELQNAQNCGKWKQFHLRVSEARHLLASGIERDYRQFCRQLQIPSDKMAQSPMQHQDKDNQQSEFFPCMASDDTTPTQVTMSLEDTLQLHLAQEWVHQDRFNIQEAFTNQTKKLHEDLDVFLAQQETEFLKKREKVLNQQCVQSGTESEAKSTRCGKASSQFLSNVKRGMQLHVQTVEQEERIISTGSKLRSNSRHIRSDIGDEVQDKLDELQRELQNCKEVAEVKHKEGMQWIGRQCAHLFAQLDSKETEARVVAMMLEEELTQIGLLHRRLREIVNALEQQCHQQSDKKGSELPRLSSASSEKRLSLSAKKNTR